jgi:hypothetical protein
MAYPIYGTPGILPSQGQSGGMGGGLEGLLGGGNPLFNMGLGILANNYGNYGNAGVAIGRGAQQGMQQTQQFRQLQNQDKLTGLNVQRAQMEIDSANRAEKARQDAIAALTGAKVAMGPMKDPNEAFKVPNLDQALMQLDPDGYIKSKMKSKDPIKLGKGDALYDPTTYKPLITPVADPAEAPKTRTVRIGTQEVTQEWDASNGKWNEVGRGAAFKMTPDVVNNNSIGFPKETFKNERDLRNDFQGLPTTKAFKEVQNSYDQITTALNNPSAANDLAAATKFMKLLDPGSVVRESELGMAMAATGQLDRMSNYYNMLKTGQKLTPQQREDFKASAEQLYGAATNRYNETANEYRNLAQEYELSPERIAKPVSVSKPQAAAPAGKVRRYNPKTGKIE